MDFFVNFGYLVVDSLLVNPGGALGAAEDLVVDPLLADPGGALGASEDDADEEGDEDVGYKDADAVAREEAQSLRHFMTHYPKNRFCPACRTAQIKLRRFVRKRKVD